MTYAWGPTRPDKHYDRLFTRRRSRRWLLVVALTLPGLVGAGIAAHRLYSPAAPTAGEVPLIRADSEPTRKRPDAPGGLEIAGQGTLALDGGQGTSSVEHLLPEPETPLPHPAPPVETAPPPPMVVAPLAAAPTAVAPESVAPPAAGPAAKPAPVAVAPSAKPAQVAEIPPALKKGYRLQLGAVRDPESAKQAWERMKERHADLLGRLTFVAARVDLGERGVFYRIQAGPLADEAHAERDCKELKRRGVSCILVRP